MAVTILAWSGPAGTGKTTQIKQHQSRNPTARHIKLEEWSVAGLRQTIDAEKRKGGAAIIYLEAQDAETIEKTRAAGIPVTRHERLAIRMKPGARR